MRIGWRILHKEITGSTNIDARAGAPGDVYTASFQTAGRGRLDHKWVSSKGENVIMSAVLDVSGIDIAQASTLPLLAGLAVVEAIAGFLPGNADVKLKWPNDVYVAGRKIAGILCERHGDCIIAGIGINVGQREFPGDVAAKAVSLRLLGADADVSEVRDAVLERIASLFEEWVEGGFDALYPRIREVDWLKGRNVSILQTDCDSEPVSGVCGGILGDGTLDVGGVSVWAGEAHVSF